MVRSLRSKIRRSISLKVILSRIMQSRRPAFLNTDWAILASLLLSRTKPRYTRCLSTMKSSKFSSGLRKTKALSMIEISSTMRRMLWWRSHTWCQGMRQTRPVIRSCSRNFLHLEIRMNKTRVVDSTCSPSSRSSEIRIICVTLPHKRSCGSHPRPIVAPSCSKSTWQCSWKCVQSRSMGISVIVTWSRSKRWLKKCRKHRNNFMTKRTRFRKVW